jgi:O-antigen/teichoic acid export membrane protein
LKVKLTSFSKNLFYSIILTASNAIMNLGIWIIAPFYILQEDIGYGALLLSISFFVCSLIENSFSTAIVTFNIVSGKILRFIILLNLGIWILATSVILAASLLLDIKINDIDYLMMIIIPFLSIFITILDNYNKIKLRYKENSVIEILSNLIAFIIFILVLIWRKDYFALIIFSLTKYITSFFLHIILTAKNIRSDQHDTLEFKDIFYFGTYILGEKVMTAIATYADTFIISYILGLKTLGVYELCKRLLLRPIILLTVAVENLALPYLSSIKDNAAEYIKFYKSYINGLSLVCFTTLGIIFLSQSSIFRILPDSYSDFQSEFSLLFYLAITIVLLNPIDLILYSTQKSKIFFWWNLSYFFPLVLVTFIGASYGIENMIIFVSSLYLILFFIVQFFVMEKHTYLKNNNFIKIGILPLILSVFAFIPALLIQHTSGFSRYTNTFVPILIFIGSLFTILYYEKKTWQSIKDIMYQKI